MSESAMRKAVGGGTTFDIATDPPRKYLLDGLSPEDYTALAEALVKERRKHFIRAFTENQDVIVESSSQEEYDRQFQNVIDRASKIQTVTTEEISTFVQTNYGILFVIWVMIDRRYPGAETMDSMLNHFNDGAITEDEVATALISVFEGLGWMGNSDGGETAPPPKKTGRQLRQERRARRRGRKLRR